MVKLSDIDLPVIFKNQLLFRSGNWNGWNISSKEVNNSVINTRWDKFNSSLIYSHRDSEYGLDKDGLPLKKDWADSWIGEVKNIHSNGVGSTYGDVLVWDPDTAVKVLYGGAPLAISAGIKWSDEFEQPTNFQYRNFCLVADPGVRDREIFLNFSSNETKDGFHYANFNSMIDGTGSTIGGSSSQGSQYEANSNEKVHQEGKHKEGCQCEECKKKANFDSNEFELVNNGGDLEMLRASIASELSAISLYEDMANKTSNTKLKQIFLDIAKEEKTHVGEFETLLKSLDPEQAKESEAGEEEVDKKVGEFCNKEDMCNEDKEKKEEKEADMMIKDSKQTETTKQEVKDKKEWTMETLDESKKKEKHEENKVNFNNYTDERRSKDKDTMTENEEPSVEDKKEVSIEGVNSNPTPVVNPSVVDKKEENMKNASPLMDEKTIGDVASKLAEKLIPNLKPAPMTNMEFGYQVRDPMEDAVERLAKKLGD